MDFNKLVSADVNGRESFAESLRMLADDVELGKVDGVVIIVDRNSEENTPLETRSYGWDYFSLIGVLTCLLRSSTK